ncbi:2-oxoglutarate and iron-dependent oxygenase domain-containing protein [Nocardia sp. NPDC050710]|uniref:isopenicillin N synthase family dioxygenase n=1 Tax=Nocardia sp. NPDC050710 TaxID=3157220 RepID=UPI00340DADB4
MVFRVPVIDITPYVDNWGAQAREGVARRVDEAARTVGFMQLRGHGIRPRVFDDFADALDDFFALDPAEKRQYRTAPEVGRGYCPPRGETLDAHDYFEAFRVGAGAADYPTLDLSPADYPENVWPQRLPGFRARVWTYYTEAARVARTLTTIFADTLGLPRGYFDRFTDHSADALRMHNYTPPADSADTGFRCMGEHTDQGLVTLLWADQVPGLQILGLDTRWHDVQPADDALLINIGDLMARWTDNRWLSTPHRVLPPVVRGTIERRRSAAFHYNGNADAVLETLPSCRATGRRYSPISVAEHRGARSAGSSAPQSNTHAQPPLVRH